MVLSGECPDNILAVEGGVGCGKTAVATRLAVERNFLFVPEYMQMVQNRQAFFESSPEDRLVRLMEIEKTRHSLVRTTLRSQVVIMDRSVLCLFAHEYARARMAREYENSQTRRLVNEIELIPNAIFFLTAAESTKRARCASRTTEISELFFDELYNRLLASFYQRLRGYLPVHFIDTSNATIAEVSERVLSLIPHRKKPNIEMLIARILQLLES